MDCLIDTKGPIPAHNPSLGNCWIWNGRNHSRGYGAVSIFGNERYAHRISYTLFVGRLTKGLVLDHLCRVKNCVNPKHLEEVSSRENLMRDPKTHGNETHCPKGHPYSGDNLYIRKDYKSRMCKQCSREAQRIYRLRTKN